MMDFSALLSYLWDGLVGTLPSLIIPVIGGVIAIRGYHWYKGIEYKDTRYKLANALSIELDSIADATSPTTTYGAGFLPHRPSGRLDDTVYKGLVTSGGIIHFDVEIQEKLYRFYGHIAENNKAAIRKDMVAMVDAVEGFRDRNTRKCLSRLQRAFGVEPQRLSHQM